MTDGSLGMLILESALNIVLPSNGDSWLKLRSDDFSELAEHYEERKGEKGEWKEGIPIISGEMMGMIKRMLAKEVEDRIDLMEIRESAMVKKAEEERWGAALMQESEDWWE